MLGGINIKIAFLDYDKTSNIASDFLVKNHKFISISINDSVRNVSKNFFAHYEQDSKLYSSVKQGFESINKYIWINDVLDKIKHHPPSSHFIVDDVTTLSEYYLLLNEGFLLVKLVDNNSFYNEQLDNIPMLRLDCSGKLDVFYEAINLLIDNYNTLYENRTKGGIIKSIENDTENTKNVKDDE